MKVLVRHGKNLIGIGEMSPGENLGFFLGKPPQRSTMKGNHVRELGRGDCGKMGPRGGAYGRPTNEPAKSHLRVRPVPPRSGSSPSCQGRQDRCPGTEGCRSAPDSGREARGVGGPAGPDERRVAGYLRGREQSLLEHFDPSQAIGRDSRTAEITSKRSPRGATGLPPP